MSTLAMALGNLDWDCLILRRLTDGNVLPREGLGFREPRDLGNVRERMPKLQEFSSLSPHAQAEHYGMGVCWSQRICGNVATLCTF